MSTLRKATAAEEQAAQDEALERHVLPRVVLAARGLEAAIDVGEFLEQVEQRCRERRVPVDRCPRAGPDTPPWLSINLPAEQGYGGGNHLSIFGPGSWILSAQSSASAAYETNREVPEAAIDRARRAAVLLRELLADGLELPPAE